jgi:hypothetical protein
MVALLSWPLVGGAQLWIVRPLSHAMKSRNFATKPLPRAVTFALVQRMVVIVFSGMILDGGVIDRACLVALVVYWGGAGLLLARRRGVALTPLDTLLIGGSCIPLCIVAFFLTCWI